MKKRLIGALALALLLSGCQGTGTDSSVQPSSPSAPAQSQQQTQSPQKSPPQQEEPEPVSLGWVSQSRGEWPFEVTVEQLQFYGSDDPALEEANDYMATDVESVLFYYETAREKGEDKCREDGDTWGSLWAYPMTTERYLNAATVYRGNMYFRTGDITTWDLVYSNFVYDKEEARLISLEDAFAMAGVDQGALEQEIWEYTDRQNLGVYEDLSSLGFYMAPEGHPVFIIGGIVRSPEAEYGWPTFFNWENGEIRWSGEEPVPLYLVDTAQDALSCQQGMGQYDGAAMISEAEAMDTLAQIAEVQDMLSQGMVMVSDGDTEYIDGEEHLCIAVGTDHKDQFVTEFLYAVSWYSVYCMDPMSGEWITVGFG